MFGSRGRGSAILEALRRAKEEDEIRQKKTLQLQNEEKRNNERNHGNGESYSSSSMESIASSTQRMSLRNFQENRGTTISDSCSEGSTTSTTQIDERSSSYYKSSSPSMSERSNSKNGSSMDLLEEAEPSKVDKTLWHGTSGEKIDLLSNCIKLNVKKERQENGFYRHQVRFEPELDSKSLRSKFISGRKDVLGPAMIFDGFSLYLPYRAQNMELHSKNQKYTMTISFFQRHDYKDKESITVYNLLIKQVCKALKMVQIKRNSFLPSKAQRLDKHGLEVWPGYVTTINDYGPSGLLLLCDMKSKVLRTHTVHDAIRDIVSKSGNNYADVQAQVKKSLIGEVVMTKYNNKTYRIDEVDFESNPLATFDKNGKEETYADYYSQQYQIRIKDLKQPLLVHHPKVPRIINEQSMDNYGPISLIPELCYMTGLSDRLRTNFTLMKDLSMLTKMSPFQRKITIEKLLQEIRENEEAKEILEQWGLRLAEKALPLSGRVLEPAFIKFGNGFRIKSNVDFSRDTLNNPMYSSVDIVNWLLVFDQRNQEHVQFFVSTLMTGRNTRNIGIEVSKPTMIALRGARTEEFTKRIRQSLREDRSIQLVVTIIDSPKSDLYSAVKKICCVENSVASQFILKKSLNPARESTKTIVGKIALQIVCKLGGELWASQSPYKNAMIVGIDVYHDPVRQHRSCLGFVASLNSSYSKWSSWTERNTEHQEISNALGICLKRALQQYVECNGTVPDRVIVYRDGVGDGRISMVEDYEAPQLLKVYQAFRGASDPPIKLSVIVVSKRVNTRVISLCGKSNPPPGTVVDTSITENRTYPNFYLVSQKVGEGTVTPTHYIIAYDNSSLSAEHAQKLSYKLTFMYYNWPGSIRVPVPCQYAHKLASLVGEYMGTNAHPALCNKLFYL
eukprot:TRINITY_DN1429_c0_g1_i3.p1 TRINITY_DN1429_c0_g1~~TRINITY_DN1429_c0_g1_i3.p1  ORF type:complete len:902 (+),score=171.92 TRINITY_DN1429_c0_g1_i3:63-2768(+)